MRRGGFAIAAAVIASGVPGFLPGVPAGDDGEVFRLELVPGVDAMDHAIWASDGRVIAGGYREAGDARACYWVDGGLRTFPDIERDGYTFRPATALEFSAATGAFLIETRCLEFAEWQRENATDPGRDEWAGPRHERMVVAIDELAFRSADFNRDRVVDARDQLAFLAAWSAQRGARR